MNVSNTFEQRSAAPSDIQSHLPALRALAARCSHVTEFGVRKGNSTIAFLAGLADRGGGVLLSYDIAAARFEPPELPPGVEWKFTRADTSQLREIDTTDLLFIDTLHTADQVRAELRHAPRVLDRIVLHDTVLFAGQGERDSLGIAPAIFEFLAAHPSEWCVESHSSNSCGLLVLARRSIPRP
jgi:hypothetical protein